jgi:hypothetical protein
LRSWNVVDAQQLHEIISRLLSNCVLPVPPRDARYCTVSDRLADAWADCVLRLTPLFELFEPPR